MLAAPEEALARPDVTGRQPPGARALGRRRGAERVYRVPVPASARPGDVRVLWVDGEDRPTRAPMPESYAAGQGILATLLVLLGGLLVSLALLAGLRWYLDRLRLRAWDEAWRRFTEPGHESLR